MKNTHDLIAGKIRLPSPPAIAIRILDAVRRDDLSFADLGCIIKSDPALMAQILKVANSPYYNCSQKVTSIETALSILGTNAVKNIALSVVLFSGLKKKVDNGFDFELFWRRAVSAAVAAELTAALVGLPDPEIFVTALLQDIGVILFYASCPEDYQLVLNAKFATMQPLNEVEQHFFGFDHQQLGAELLESWHLPEDIHVPILYHHSNDQVPERYRKQVDILKVSDYLSAVYHGCRSVDKCKMVRCVLHDKFGFQGEAVDDLIDAVATRSLDIFSSFDIPAGSVRPFSLILQEANEELSKLNNSYDLLMIELRQAKEKAEKLANELFCANARLHEMAFRDCLTGLYNHRYFQEMLDKEIERAKRYENELSLLFLDIDYFKKVNDTYGHPTGDRVLAEISRVMEQSVRNVDFVARYGGEEFAVILPETGFQAARNVAERLRGNIENHVIEVDGRTIKVTVSIGCTGCNCDQIKGKGALVDLADRALYIAKLSGRNMVHAMNKEEDAGAVVR